MPKKIHVISGSPKKNGNTSILVGWFLEGVEAGESEVKVAETAFLNYRTPGCTSCRICQSKEEYGCVINDDGAEILSDMLKADVIVFATPLYFFSASAQIKIILDRMFSLYKWDNAAGTVRTPLKGKTLVLIASAYEDIGLEALAKPFILTAEYTGMEFMSLLVPNAGVSGEIVKLEGAKKRAVELGRMVAG